MRRQWLTLPSPNWRKTVQSMLFLPWKRWEEKGDEDDLLLTRNFANGLKMKERLFRQQIKAKRRSSYKRVSSVVGRRIIMYTCNSFPGQKVVRFLHSYPWNIFDFCAEKKNQKVFLREITNDVIDMYFEQRWKRVQKCSICDKPDGFCKGWATFTFTLTSHNFWLGKGKGEKRNGRVQRIYEPSHVMLLLQLLQRPSSSALIQQKTADDFFFQLNIVTRVHLKKEGETTF